MHMNCILSWTIGQYWIVILTFIFLVFEVLKFCAKVLYSYELNSFCRNVFVFCGSSMGLNNKKYVCF